MKLGIPTLNNPDGVMALINSAEAGSLKPDGYIVIDNGGMIDLDAKIRADFKIRVIRPERNAGVSGSWNRLLCDNPDETIAISNDDIVFGPDTFRLLVEASASHPFVGAAGGWALFAQSPECTEKVGFYDELFYPAYYEDCDYLLRMQRKGIPVHDIGFAGATHQGEMTTRLASPEECALIYEGRARNKSYFVTKWGSNSPRWGDPYVTNYPEPFNGKLVAGASDRTSISPMRYDVLNFIASKIGAKRYLEIGVSDGESMRHVNVQEKWGIDPFPHPEGVKAATVFVPQTSDHFFEHIAQNSGLFDLVFIDGDHRAEQIYREVRSAMKFLSPNGVICLHDCNPHTEEMQTIPQHPGEWTGDVWKGIARLRSEGFPVRVIPSDFGIGVVLPNRGARVEATKLPCEWDRLLWRDLVADRERLLGLVPPGGWQDWLSSAFT